MGQIDQFEHAFDTLVAAFGAAFYLVDPRRIVLARNEAARDLDRQGGVLAVDAQGALVTRSGRGDQALIEALERLLGVAEQDPHRNHATALLVGGHETVRGTLVHLLTLADVPGRVMIKVPRVVVAPDATLLPDVLRQVYGLTRAEGRLAAAMLTGQTSGADLAETLGRSEWTVRTQIRSLLAKLGATTKTEAIARMSAEVLPMDFAAYVDNRPVQKSGLSSSDLASRARASRAP